MKKFLRSLILFIPFAAVFYLLMLMGWGSIMPDEWKKNLNYRRGASGFAYTRFMEAKKSGTTEVLFAGSSHAYRGFDPRIFKEYGFTSFNLGSSSQTPLQTASLLEKYLDRFVPATVVYEVYPYTFSSDGVESALDVIANDDIDAGSCKMAFVTNNIKVYNTLLYGCLKRMIFNEEMLTEKLTSTGRNKDVISHTAYIKGGFMEYSMEHAGTKGVATGFAVINPAAEKSMLSEAGIVHTKEGRWAPKEYQIGSFEKTLDLLRSKNIRVILVQAPVHSKYYSMIKCNDEIDAYFRSKGEYYNFNTLMPFDDTADFADYHHLNQQGVRKMNITLIEKVFNKK